MVISLPSVSALVHNLIEQDENDQQPFDFGNGAREAAEFLRFKAGRLDFSLAQKRVVQTRSLVVASSYCMAEWLAY